MCPIRRPPTPPVPEEAAHQAEEGICAGGTSLWTRLSWGLESIERPMLLREVEPPVNFPALFPWKPDEDSMSTMLLGTIAYAKNDPTGKLHLGWEEL